MSQPYTKQKIGKDCFVCGAGEPEGPIGFLFEPLPEGPICDNCAAVTHRLGALGAKHITRSMVLEALKAIEAHKSKEKAFIESVTRHFYE